MTPFVLIAGFLGAGKTTFLRALLPALGARGVRPRVILNDYQNARVDAASLQDLTATLVPISGSCLCCETQEELLEALGTMELAEGDAVVIETNGTTDTASLLEFVTASPRLDRLDYPIQLTLVDAQRLGRRGWQSVLEREQLATATHVGTSRLDLVDEARRAEVAAAVAEAAPRAAATTPAAFADEIAALARDLRGLPGRGALAPRAGADDVLAAGASRPEHEARHHFASFQLPLPGPVDPAAFVRFLEELPPEIVRAKGIVVLTDPPGEKRLFQKVEGTAEISPCQLADADELEPVGVFIGAGASSLAVRARLAKLKTG